MRIIALTILLLVGGCVPHRNGATAAMPPELTVAVWSQLLTDLANDFQTSPADTAWAWRLRFEGADAPFAELMSTELLRAFPAPADTADAEALRLVSVRRWRSTQEGANIEVWIGLGRRCASEWRGSSTIYEYRFTRASRQWRYQSRVPVGYTDAIGCLAPVPSAADLRR